MLDAENQNTDNLDAGSTATGPEQDQAADPGTQETSSPEAPAKKATATRSATKKTAAKKTTAKKTTAKKTTAKKTTAKKTTAKKTAEPESPSDESPVPGVGQEAEPASGHAEPPATAKEAAKKAPAKKAPAKKAAAKRTTKKAAAEPAGEAAAEAASTEQPRELSVSASSAAEEAAEDAAESTPAADESRSSATMLLFQPPDARKTAPRRKKAEQTPAAAEETGRETAAAAEPEAGSEAAPDAGAGPERPKGKKTPGRRRAAQPDTDEEPAEQATEQPAAEASHDRAAGEGAESEEGDGTGRRRRRRGGRRRRKSGDDGADNDENADESSAASDKVDKGDKRETSDAEAEAEAATSSSRRRRRRRRSGEVGETDADDPENTVTRVRKPRTAEDEITALSGSTRLEAKKQRRREGREAGRRRAPIVSEAEFLARREAVDRVMVIRQKQDLTQIAVLEDKVLVEHYVARESQTSLIGNVYLGRVQNVLPSMEAAFIDIGKGRNAVLYAGEVNWDALGAKDGQPRKIESVLKSGQSVLVQVTKDPIGHKGARLTSQISLPGRFLVYVPDGTTSGISRKLPDTERSRLKTLLKEIVPDSAGVIVRTAAEGASEEELTRDVERLTARWDDIQSKVKGGSAPQLLYGEPDLTLKVVRDLFTEDFARLVVSGQDAWDMVDGYVRHVAPDLEDRLEKFDGDAEGKDVFAAYRIDEQIAKGLDRKVWLPSGGSLIIDRTEAMTVVDVNTGKFTGSGGNLEETVTKNNLEAAEEIVRQLRLRDIGGIIVVDFIDMVLESNRDLVLRRMVECLGRDRTRHQVAEVTSLGLVQMTRKRIGTGLLEAFSESCEHCGGRGLVVHHDPVEPKKKTDEEPRRSRRGGRGRGRDHEEGNGNGAVAAAPSPKDIAMMAKSDRADRAPDGEEPAELQEPAADGAESAQSTEATEPTGQPAVDEPAQTADAHPSPADEADATPADTEPEKAAEEPKRTTRATTRKRSARRAQGPAGEPTVVTAPEPEVATTGGSKPPAATDASQGATTSGTGSEGDTTPVAAAAASDGTPPAPKVVATVRRRGAARRPAGPPSGTASRTGGEAGEGEGRSAVALAEHPHDVPETSVDEAPPAPAHVPVKKKGSRKR